MNIEQYRELKAKEAEQAQAPVVEQPVEAEPIIEEEPTPVVQTAKIKVGDEEIDIEELKNGYLRQSDYTKKTQEVSRQKTEAKEAIEFYEHLKSNPELVQTLQETNHVPSYLDPNQSKVIELESKMYDMMLEKEIEKLQSKYTDFEVMDVLNVADAKGLTNLEDAYHLSKSSKSIPSDEGALRESLRKEILLEMQNEQQSTRTIITTPGTQSKPEASIPTISHAEAKVAGMMKMSENEYITWRDANK